MMQTNVMTGTDDQAPRGDFFGVLKAGFARFIVIEPSPHEWQQLMGGGCRNDAATDGIKQHCAKLIFKVFDAFADSRLCDVQFLGST